MGKGSLSDSPDQTRRPHPWSRKSVYKQRIDISLSRLFIPKREGILNV
jgi:hypothetical protein